MARKSKKRFQKPKGNSPVGGKKKPKVINVNKKVMKQLQLSSRVSNVEKQLEALLNSKKEEAQFQAGMMFGINALVDVLQSKNIITMDELETARIKTIQEYQQEKIEEAKRAEVAKRYKHDPVHYDSTLDKWFVFAPNWKDKVGPFIKEEAAREALRIIKGEPDPNAEPEAEPESKPAEASQAECEEPLPDPTPEPTHESSPSATHESSTG